MFCQRDVLFEKETFKCILTARMLLPVLSVFVGAFMGQFPLSSARDPVDSYKAVNNHINLEEISLSAVHPIQKRQAGQSQSFDAEGSHNLFQAPNAVARNMDQRQLQRELSQRTRASGFGLPVNTDDAEEGGKSGGFGGGFGGGRGGDEDDLCPPNIQCDPHSRYRSINGSCNNLVNSRWGSALICFQRLLYADYSDGVSAMRLTRSGQNLPNPRAISVQLNTDVDRPTETIALMHVMFGQFLDHDISLTPFSRTIENDEIECCGIPPMERHPQCAEIEVDAADPFYSTYDIRCLNFVRSTLCESCLIGPRQQTNQISSFIDASQVYGSTEETFNMLRSNSGDGTLAVQENQRTGPLLPPSLFPNNDQCSIPEQNEICFEAGDQRVNQQPALVSFHLVFVRQHNRLARSLRYINPHWDGEKLFQEVRRILIAQLQMIVYNEYLPPLVGKTNIRRFNLGVQHSRSKYDPTIDPTLYNEFSTAAFRYGHSMINDFFPEIPERRATDKGHFLRDLFFKPLEVARGKMEHHIRGLAEGQAQQCDRHLAPDVTTYLYRRSSNETGLDLAAFNIQRGRDHGLPGYTQYLRYIKGLQVDSFDDLDGLMLAETRGILENLYESVHDIDLYAGGLSEIPETGALVGPVFAYILALQYSNLKFGDRFYFEHYGQVGSFTPAQRAEIKKTSLAKLICENTKIREIQPRAMEYPSESNNKIDCNRLPDLNLSRWREWTK